MSDDDVREFLALTLNLKDRDMRELLEHTPTPEQSDFRLQCVRESWLSK